MERRLAFLAGCQRIRGQSHRKKRRTARTAGWQRRNIFKLQLGKGPARPSNPCLAFLVGAKKSLITSGRSSRPFLWAVSKGVGQTFSCIVLLRRAWSNRLLDPDAPGSTIRDRA
jgi:hypothetical protein